MAKKDERGVVIPAPLQFGDPSVAGGPRYDDEHRGPGVRGAYDLAHCRIDLMERSRSWIAPQDRPERLKRRAEAVPEDQREEWLQRQWASDEVDYIIGNAVRSGDLSVWIAPKDDDEKPVPASAILELDHATIVSGCYRPLNDRKSWLFGRPLFVKKDDWVRFVRGIEYAKQSQKREVSKQSKESGSTDWIRLNRAVQAVYQAIEAAEKPDDPAPWRQVSDDEISMFSEGDEDAFVLRKKRTSLSIFTFARALLNGELVAHFEADPNYPSIPGWAWEGTEQGEETWFHGSLSMDVLLPDEWQEVSGLKAVLDHSSFDAWLATEAWTESGDFPKMPSAHDRSERPELIRKRRLPEEPFVGLCYALTWSAFGIAMDRESLHRAVFEGSSAIENAETKLIEALAKIVMHAGGGDIEARGKFMAHHHDDPDHVLTQVIEPIRFEDFAKYDILYGALRIGTGLTWRSEHNSIEWIFSGRHDCLVSVKLKRDDVLRYFPDKDDIMAALLSPIPATLPNIGPVMGLSEALSWLAHNSPSYDYQVWQGGEGGLEFRDPSGATLALTDDGSPPQSIQEFSIASRRIHRAFQEGNLASYVAPQGESPLQVPRVYWNGVNPESLDHIYRGTVPRDHGAGCLILLSREAFSNWRATMPALEDSDQPRPTHNDIVEWCRQWIDSGKGNGMDKAWETFKLLPDFKGLSRDDVFRPAWREAKTL